VKVRLSRGLAVAALTALSSVALGAFAAPARAQSAPAENAPKKRIFVAGFKGPKPTSARETLTRGLSDDARYEVIAGEVAPLDDTSPSGVLALAEKYDADVVVSGKTALKKKGWQATLDVYDGGDGRLIESVTLGGRSYDEYQGALASGDELDGALARALGRPRATADNQVAEPEAAEEPNVVESAPAEAPQKLRPSPLDLRLGARLYARDFSYTDTLAQLFPGGGFTDLVSYNLAAAPMPFGQATWYPAAHFSDRWFAHVGVRGGYEQGVATTVAFQGGVLEQAHSLWYAGLRGRLPIEFAPTSHAELGALATFANHSFSIGGAPGQPAQSVFPSVDYKMLELGGDAEWRIDGLILGAYAKYLLVVDVGSGPGQIASAEWFSGTQAVGVDFGGNVGWEISRVFDLLAGIDVRAYGLDFPAPAADAAQDRVAGGARDRYISFWGGLGIHWPGDAPPEAPAADDDF